MDFDHSEQVKALAGLPPEPTKPRERGLWATAWAATKAGAAETVATVGKVAKAYGAAQAQADEANPLVVAGVGREAAQRGAERGREIIASGDIETEVGRSFRSVAADLAPDPVTAGEAEKLVFALGRGLTKAVGSTLALGPAGGAALFGASEADTTFEDLRVKGVDAATAGKVALTTGAISAGSVVLPMAGPTLKATAGLYLAGGPGGFVAQQVLTRSILERADYADMARQYDPLDPTGLALSALIPLPFAAHGAVRNVRSAKAAPSPGVAPPRADHQATAGTQVAPEPIASPAAPVPRDAADAAMVHNQTILADAQRVAIDLGEPAVTVERVSPVPGAVAEVVTERGLTAPVRYRLIEAGDLVTSHADDLAPNAAFPAELQPRDRTRAASADQVARIENRIDPELLGESRKASDGAPIVGPDGVVESGNARTIALRRAYGSDKADGYRAWLAENAERFGLTREDVAGMQRPVLVRERLGEIDRAEFARQANESPIAALSPTEQARADATRMSDLSGLATNDDGTINATRSREWLRGFMQRVSPTERGALMQADGQLSQAGAQRVRNAVFSKAYGDSSLLAGLAESTDSNVRNVLAGLMRVAPEVARLRELMEAGARQPIDVAASAVRAVREFSKLRAEGMTVDQFLAQGSLLEGVPPEVKNLLIGLRDNARSQRRVAEMVRSLVQSVDDLGDPRQRALLDDQPKASQADMAADAVERMRTLTDDQLAGIEPAQTRGAQDALVRSIADRVQAVEMTSPDMPIGKDADGRPITAAEELARVRREAAEGTDTELGALDAELLRVAADCALSTGGL
jgi:ddrB-like ParB superfamily domain